MLFFGLSPLARKAVLALAVVVLVITIFTPDADSSSKSLPMGAVVSNTGTQVTVRTGDGELHTVDMNPADVVQCTAGRTFPTCAH